MNSISSRLSTFDTSNLHVEKPNFSAIIIINSCYQKIYKVTEMRSKF